MKKLITFSTLGLALMFTVSVSAQEKSKIKTAKIKPQKENATVIKEEKQETKTAEMRQEDKTEMKKDSTKKSGGTRMAISNKGLPSKKKGANTVEKKPEGGNK